LFPYTTLFRSSDEAPAAVLKLSGLMEYMLYESNEDLIPLNKELEYLQNYLELEKLRSDNQANIQLEVGGDAEHCLVAPFLVLPVLENAIKHGLNNTDGNAYLHLSISIETYLDVKLINSTANHSKQNHKGGIGLQNLRKRLELLYPDKH